MDDKTIEQSVYGLIMLVLVLVLTISASIAVGVLLGAGFGFLAYATFTAIEIAFVIRAFKKTLD